VKAYADLAPRKRLEFGLWILFLAAVAGCAVGWAISPAFFGPAWLAALMFWLGWPVGSIGLAWIHVITGGRWGRLAWPQLVLGIVAAPVMVLAIIPLLILAHPIYPWSFPHIAKTLENTRYLNLPFFWGRVSGMVVLWVLLAALVLVLRRRFVAGFCLALMLLSVTIVAVDINLSLEPHFNSTAFGMVIAAEWTLFALAIATLGAALDATADSDGLEALGKLLLAVLILWGYLVFVQFLIVWNSDLGSDAPWYVRRAEHGWGIVAAILFVFHFVVPFLALLRREWQRSRPVLMGVSALLIATEIPRAWWLVLPSFGGISWIGGIAMLAVVALGAAMVLRLAIIVPPLLSRLGVEVPGHA
jgi:hypothetical protein